MGIHVLKNDKLEITVKDAGAELCGVIDLERGAQRLWNADPAVWNRHAPILFPFVGKVTGGQYTVGDRTYAMKTQHGFARDRDFECVEASESYVTHRLTADDSTREIYPYDFALTVKHSLESDNPRLLRIEWQVENRGKDTMYYSIGGHPGFMMPDGAKKEDCFIGFKGTDKPVYFGVTPQGFALPDKKTELATEGGFVPYQDSIPDTWIFAHQGIEQVCIAGPDKKPYVTMSCAQFPLLAVWANPKGPFICLEPWFGRTDDDGFTGGLEEKPEMEKLAPGGVKVIEYTVEFH